MGETTGGWRERWLWAASISMALAAPCLASTAHACVMVAPPPTPTFVVDPDAWPQDTIPPAAFDSVQVSTVRTAASFCRAGSCTTTSCASGGGQITIHGDHPAHGSGEELGVRIVLVSGTLPFAMRPLLDEIRPMTDTLTFFVEFGEITRLDAVVQLIAVDHAGNESPPSDPVPLRWSGCTVAPGAQGCIDEDEFECTPQGCSERTGWQCSVAAPGLARGFSGGLTGGRVGPSPTDRHDGPRPATMPATMLTMMLATTALVARALKRRNRL